MYAILKVLPLRQVLLSPGMSQFTMVKMLACPQAGSEGPGRSGIPRQSSGTEYASFCGVTISDSNLRPR